MDHPFFSRFAQNMIGRVSGPMKFRLVMQPCMAIFLAVRGGLQDARAGKPPYFWGVCTDKGERESMMKDGWKHIAKVFILAVALDVVYQLIELHFVYIGEAIAVAIILAIIPYLLVRGPVNRLARRDRKIAKGHLAGS